MTLEGLRKLLSFIDIVDFVLFVSFYGDEYKDLVVNSSRKHYLLAQWKTFCKNPLLWLSNTSIEVRQRFLNSYNGF